MSEPPEPPDRGAGARRRLGELRAAHLLRQRQVVKALDATHVEVEGRRYVNFGSNNYLGLTHHPKVMAAACEAVAKYGAGSGAAGLVSGHGPAHDAAERTLAEWKGTEGAVLLPSGYQANLAAVQTLSAIAPAGVRFLLDKFCHASLIDAVRDAGHPFRVYPHNHLSKLRRLLEEAEVGQTQVVVTESVFSMDGDAADLHGLAAMKRETPFLLLLDEAHGTGVYGPDGNGYAAECGLQPAVDVSVVTLSKALGVAGGAVCAGRDFCEAVLNFGRAYIYSTAVPPSIAAAAEAAISVIHNEPHRRVRLRDLARRVRGELHGSAVMSSLADSPIIPIVLGTEEAALRCAEGLRGEGLLVPAIRPPTVARGTSRLRVTLCCEHSDDEVDLLLRTLRSTLRA